MQYSILIYLSILTKTVHTLQNLSNLSFWAQLALLTWTSLLVILTTQVTSCTSSRESRNLSPCRVCTSAVITLRKRLLPKSGRCWPSQKCRRGLTVSRACLLNKKKKERIRPHIKELNLRINVDKDNCRSSIRIKMLTIIKRRLS